MYAFVIAKDGSRLMPTNIRKARRLLEKGKAVICRHHPFTIQLTGESGHYTPPVEFCEDTGSEHIGVSIKSETHEYVHAQYDNLRNETQRHQDQLMYRRTRRNRLRYRKPRFNNRRRDGEWLAPSVKHKKDNHIRIFDMYAEVCPITRAIFEVGQFDPAGMQTLEETGEVLQGTDYQRGKRYQLANLREAVFTRDHYTCQVCGRSVTDGVILHAHHIVYRSKGGTDADTGAVNRKLGSDMADSVTGGGLHGKDVSKADVSVNIYAFLKAQTTGEVVEMDYAIGDTEVNGIPYAEIVRVAKEYIDHIGGFELLCLSLTAINVIVQAK